MTETIPPEETVSLFHHCHLFVFSIASCPCIGWQSTQEWGIWQDRMEIVLAVPFPTAYSMGCVPSHNDGVVVVLSPSPFAILLCQ